ncbi:hypothetical protein BD779DRAFT_1418341, partial [Infundibulicybe gibba]
FVPHTEDMKIAMEFQQALRRASLDNGDLDAELLNNLRNPVQELLTIRDNDILLSIRLFLSTTNASERVYHEVRADITERYPDSKILSHSAIKKEIVTMTGVFPIVHDMCPGSCVAYT